MLYLVQNECVKKSDQKKNILDFLILLRVTAAIDLPFKIRGYVFRMECAHHTYYRRNRLE